MRTCGKSLNGVVISRKVGREGGYMYRRPHPNHEGDMSIEAGRTDTDPIGPHHDECSWDTRSGLLREHMVQPARPCVRRVTEDNGKR